MCTSGNNYGEFKFMTLGSMNKVTRQIWDSILISDTVINQANALSQGQHNDLELLDSDNLPIRQLEIIGVDAGENEAPYIELV